MLYSNTDVDLKKIIDVSLLPSLLVIVVNLIAMVAAYTIFYGPAIKFLVYDWLNSLSVELKIIIWVLNVILFTYAGYRSVRKFKFDLLPAGVVGLLSFIISHMVLAILNLIFVLFVFSDMAPRQMLNYLSMMGIEFLIFFFIGAILNVMFAVFGGAFAQSTLQKAAKT